MLFRLRHAHVRKDTRLSPRTLYHIHICVPGESGSEEVLATYWLVSTVYLQSEIPDGCYNRRHYLLSRRSGKQNASATPKRTPKHIAYVVLVLYKGNYANTLQSLSLCTCTTKYGI